MKQFNLSEIRHDIASLLQPPGWNSYFHYPETWKFPAIIVDVDAIEYQKDYGDGAAIHLRLTIYTSLAEHERAQQLVDEFLSWGTTTSAPLALTNAVALAEIESFKTAQILTADNFRVVSLNESQLAYAADLTIDVRT